MKRDWWIKMDRDELPGLPGIRWRDGLPGISGRDGKMAVQMNHDFQIDVCDVITNNFMIKLK